MGETLFADLSYKTMMKQRRFRVCAVLACCVACAILAPPCRWRLVGLIKGESFYDGRPTSYWKGQVQEYCRSRWDLQDPNPSGSFFARSLGLRSPKTKHRPAPLYRPSELSASGEENDPKAVPVLAQLLEDTDVAVRSYASWYLVWVGPEARTAVPALGRALRQDVDSVIRMQCAWTLCTVGYAARPALPALREALVDEPEVAYFAACALMRIDPEAAQPVAVRILVQAVRDESFRDRYYLLREIGHLGPAAQALTPALRECLREGDWQELVAKALEQIDPEGAKDKAK